MSLSRPHEFRDKKNIFLMTGFKFFAFISNPFLRFLISSGKAAAKLN